MGTGAASNHRFQPPPNRAGLQRNRALPGRLHPTPRYHRRSRLGRARGGGGVEPPSPPPTHRSHRETGGGGGRRESGAGGAGGGAPPATGAAGTGFRSPLPASSIPVGPPRPSTRSLPPLHPPPLVAARRGRAGCGRRADLIRGGGLGGGGGCSLPCRPPAASGVRLGSIPLPSSGAGAGGGRSEG